jgi:nitrous oxide reductase accessory protein NosL
MRGSGSGEEDGGGTRGKKERILVAFSGGNYLLACDKVLAPSPRKIASNNHRRVCGELENLRPGPDLSARIHH